MSIFTRDFVWTGRTDTEDGEAGSRWHQKIRQSKDDADVALVGFGCDLGVINNKGRPGAKTGPNAIRAALSNMAWHRDIIATDHGTVEAVDDLDMAQQHYATSVTHALTQSRFVIGLGGGHEIAWGSYQGIRNALASQNKKIGIINFDAHFDLRKPAPNTSSGTPFYQIAEDCKTQNELFYYACMGVAESANTQALFAYADTHNVTYLKDTDTHFEQSVSVLTPFLQAIDVLYVTICLDAFPAAYAPGVSAPSPLGISPEYVIKMLHWFAQQQSTFHYAWPFADIAEMNPVLDIDGRTAKLAARLIFEMVNAKF